MSELWHVLKKSLHCRSDSSEVHNPQASRRDERKKHCKSVRDERNKRHSQNQVSHEIFFDRSSGEIKICPCYPTSQVHEEPPSRTTKLTIHSSKPACVHCDQCHVFSKKKVPQVKDSSHPPKSTPRRDCEDKIKSSDTVEEQENAPLHSVIQLEREHSSSKIIEQICQGNFMEGKAHQIECVLRVQSKQRTFASYEECRELVRVRAERLQNQHPRCLVDGNELLRFHGTTLACSLGSNASSSSTPCNLDQCGVCQILKHGFSSNQESFHGALGVCTTSTSGKAIRSICSSNNKYMLRKCVMLCRVIAGRIHNPLQEIKEVTDRGFDSLVKKMRDHSEIEELIVLNPRAVLPCFLVIYNF